MAGSQTKQSLVFASATSKALLQKWEHGLQKWIIGTGRKEKDRQAPHGVGDGRALGEIGQRAQHPLLHHDQLVLTGRLLKHGKKHARKQHLVRLAGRNELVDDAIHHI